MFRQSRQSRRFRPLAPVCLALVPLLLATGCGGSDEPQRRSEASADAGGTGGTAGATVDSAPSAGVVAPAKVEVIAGLAGCEVTIRTEADELREGVCRGKDGSFLITTFPEERLKRTWLDAASIYGGTYLVGNRWVVSAEEPVLKELRGRLGGEIQKPR